MTELIRTNDIVLIGFAQSLLEGADIPVLVADNHMSLMEGSIGAFPRRLLVPGDHAAQARRLLLDAGLGARAAGRDRLTMPESSRAGRLPRREPCACCSRRAGATGPGPTRCCSRA